MQELAIIRARHGMGDSGEIIDQRETLHPELFIDQRGADDPWIIGEADDIGEVAGGAHGTGNRHADGCGKGAALAVAEGLPSGLEARVIGGAEGFGRIEADRPVRADAGDGKTRMGSADIDRYQIAHDILPVHRVSGALVAGGGWVAHAPHTYSDSTSQRRPFP